MNDRFTDRLDEMMDRYVFGLADQVMAGRIRRKIEQDPHWKLAYEAAMDRRKALGQAVRAGAAEEAATSAPTPEDILAAGRAREDARRRRRRAGRFVFGGVAAAAALVIGVMWIRFAAIQPPEVTIRLIGQKDLVVGTSPSVLAVVTDMAGHPVPSVPVRFELRYSGPDHKPAAQLGVMETDAAGRAVGPLKLPAGLMGAYWLAAIAGERASTIEVPIHIHPRPTKLYLSTDKPIYQPGQTVHMRCLALRKPRLAPAAGADATFTVTDPSGNVVFSRTDKLSEYGIASADLPTDPLISPGRYRVKARVGNDASEQTVEIFHYKLPAFTVTVRPDQPYYLPGRTVRGTVVVRYHFGKPAAGARVELVLADRPDATAETLRGHGDPGARADVTADTDGKAAFALELPRTVFGSRQTAGDARLVLTVRATDPAGQENTAYKTIVVARQDIRIAVVAENGSVAPGVANRIYVVTTYADGRPAKTVVDVESLGRSFRTDDAGVAVIRTRTVPDPLRISARDTDGRTGRTELSIATAAGDAFILRTDRPSYTAGETVKVEIVAAGTGEVLVDLIKDRQTLLTRSVSIDEGRGTLALDLPAELSGLLHLHTYRLDRESEWVGRDVLIAVRPAGELKVAVTTDSDTYRPGDQAKLRFEVTDSSGAAAPAALSLAAVDEAVFSLQQAAPGLEAVLTGLDEELLAPAVEVHGFTPALAPRSDNYARAMLAAAAPRPVSGRSLLRELEAEGYVRRDSLREWSRSEIRELLRRHPRMAERLGPEIVDELTGVASGAHSLDNDNLWSQRDAFRDDRDDARGQAVAITVIGSVSVLIGLIAMALLAALRNAASEPGRVRGIVGAIIVGICLLLFIASIILPSLGRSMELARRSMLGADLAGIQRGMAIRDAEQGGDSTVDTAAGHEADGADGKAVRTRTYFPETMLWRPQVVTDESGRAELSIPLPDSITTWRVSGSAVSKVGRLGRVAGSVRVFQPFFVDVNAPLSLTAGDEVSVPLVLYNYTAENLEVYLTATGADGLDVVDKDKSSVLVTPGAPRRVYVRARAGKPGAATLTIKASAGAVADAIRREIRIVAPGLPRWRAVNGTLAEGEQGVDLLVPSDAVPDSVAVRMKIYPSTFSELIDGLENILRMPHGCFEQTSSTTYPNVMALSYMKARGIASPEVTAKAQRYIHLGYQRLLSFEVKGGGFDWFGRPPANVMLTAYGLMEFADMAKVHNVDPRLLQRTADWLGRRQNADGSWQLPGRSFHEPFTGGDASPLAATAYVTWALASYSPSHPAAERGAAYLAASWGSTQKPCTLALCANALLAVDLRSGDGLAAARKLADRARPAGASQCFFPADGGEWRRPGGMMDVTSTALAALALMKAGERADLVQDSLRWLAGQRDPHGTWSSTMPTVLALKALLAGADAPKKRTGPARIAVFDAADGARLADVTIDPDASDAVRTVPLQDILTPGTRRLRLRAAGADGMGYQLAVRYHSLAAAPAAGGPLSVKVDYDRTNLTVGGTVAVLATVTNRGDAQADMLVVDLGTPPGFVVRPAGLDRLVRRRTIQRYTLTARGVIVYLERLAAGESLEIGYEIAATMPIKAVAAPTEVYTYYAPERRAAAKAAAFTVK